jgi:hypothetical protein
MEFLNFEWNIRCEKYPLSESIIDFHIQVETVYSWKVHIFNLTEMNLIHLFFFNIISLQNHLWDSNACLEESRSLQRFSCLETFEWVFERTKSNWMRKWAFKKSFIILPFHSQMPTLFLFQNVTDFISKCDWSFQCFSLQRVSFGETFSVIFCSKRELLSEDNRDCSAVRDACFT